MTESQADLDTQDLKRLGYAQELLREMGGFSNFAFSFSVISILTGATQLYGFGLLHGGPLQLTVGWITVSFFTLIVALSMSELASAYPTSGALYHWSSALGGRAIGWMTACFNILGQLASLAGVDYGLSQFLIEILNFPESASLELGLCLLIFASHGIINHFGIRLVGWLNHFSAWYHITAVGLLLGALSFKGFVQPFHFAFTFHSPEGMSGPYSFLLGLLVAQWTLNGFEASAQITEETIDPRRNAPKGILMSVILSGVFGALLLLVVTLSIPSMDQALSYGDAAFSEIIKLRMGESFGTFLAVMVAGAMWLCGLSVLTSASRIVYAFSRDQGLPGWKMWSYVSPKYKTPVYAIWLIAGLALLLVGVVNIYQIVITVATILLYLSYGLPILVRLFSNFKSGEKKVVGPWNLGRWSNPIAIAALIWVSFITVVFTLPPREKAGLILIEMVTGLGLIWVVYARKRFAGPAFLSFGKENLPNVEGLVLHSVLISPMAEVETELGLDFEADAPLPLPSEQNHI